MVIYPLFKVIANGRDISNSIKDRLLRLTLDDRAGLESDELILAVSGIYDRPELGDTLSLALGANGISYDYGRFKVQSTAVDHKTQSTVIRAMAVDFTGSIKERKSRLWETVSLADIASQIASENALSTVINGAQEVRIASKVQNNKSDLAFMEQLADEYGFMFTIKNSTLMLLKKHSKNNNAEISINAEDCTVLSIEQAAKASYSSVTLEWQDLDSGTIQTVNSGNGSPVYYIRDVQPGSPQEAQYIADGRLNILEQRTIFGRLSIPGGMQIQAGTKLILSGSGEDDGEYFIDGVVHNIIPHEYTVNVEFSQMSSR